MRRLCLGTHSLHWRGLVHIGCRTRKENNKFSPEKIMLSCRNEHKLFSFIPRASFILRLLRDEKRARARKGKSATTRRD